MELVRAGGILGRIVSTNEELGTRELEYFIGTNYNEPKRMTIGINTGETLKTKFNVGDKVVSYAGTKLEVAGYSSDVSFRNDCLAVVFTEHTWGNDRRYDLDKVKSSEQFREELASIGCGTFMFTKLTNLCTRMITKIEELEDE